jgi:outer membrane protein TolC
MSVRASLLVLLGLLNTVPALARPMSLEVALETARGASPELLFAAARIEQALGDRQMAGYLLPGNPQIQGNAEGTLPLADGQDWAWGIGLTLPLEAPGQRPHRVKAADAAWRAASRDLDSTHLQLRSEIAALYFDLMFQEQRTAALLDVADQAGRVERAVRTKLSAGDVGFAEHSLVLADSAERRADAVTAQTDMGKAQLRLRLRLGLSPEHSMETEGGFPALTPAAGLADLLARGEARPDLAAAELRVKQAEREFRLRRAELAPDLELHFGFSAEKSSFDQANFAPGVLADPRDNAQIIGMGIAIPLPIARSGRGEVTVAHGNKQETEAELAALRRSVSIEIGLARADYEGARERVALLAGTRGDLKRATSLYEEAWASGRVGLTDYLAFRDRMVRASLAALDAHRDGAISAAALEAAVAGSFLEDSP